MLIPEMCTQVDRKWTHLMLNLAVRGYCNFYLFSLCGRSEEQKQTSKSFEKRKTFQTRSISTRTRVVVCVHAGERKWYGAFRGQTSFGGLTNATRYLSSDERPNLKSNVELSDSEVFTSQVTCVGKHRNQMEFILLFSFKTLISLRGQISRPHPQCPFVAMNWQSSFCFSCALTLEIQNNSIAIGDIWSFHLISDSSLNLCRPGLRIVIPFQFLGNIIRVVNIKKNPNDLANV